MQHEVSWRLDRTIAHLRCGPLSGIVDLSLPSDGLHQMRLDGRAFDGCRWLAVDLEPPDEATADWYERGPDLVATYPQTARRPFRVQVYWRGGMTRLDGGEHPHVDLQLSIETNLLDSRPILAASTHLPMMIPEIVVQGSKGWRLVRFAQCDVSYVELPHADDALSVEFQPGGAGGTTIVTRWFGCPLEKGVILRSRLRGLFLPRKNDEALAAAAFAAFKTEPPPLTA